jgi:hypothetical protein
MTLEVSFTLVQATAYFAAASATKKRSFIGARPALNVIKLFSFVTDDETQ